VDLVLAQTFLAVATAGSLVKAAERLHLTQAAVSARLQTLEALVEQKLFVRNKAGARLTPAGRAFLPYATQLTSTWEQARRSVAAQDRESALLSVGGEMSLWNAVLLDWLVALRQRRKSLLIRTQVDTVTRLVEQTRLGALDIAVLYSPHRRPGVEISLLLEEQLVLVSTKPGQTTASLTDYVYVDWGPDFRAHHDEAFPELCDATTRISFGPLALQLLLRVGGSGYFRTRAVEPYLRSCQLYLVQGAPSFAYSIHAATSPHADPELVAWALAELRRVTEPDPCREWAV
jgi:DNA-binding transcriptional LysR family regulator